MAVSPSLALAAIGDRECIMVSRASQMEKQLGWKVLNAAASAVSVVVTQHLLAALWRRISSRPLPENPADQNATLGAALTWAIAMGVGVAVSRLFGLRLAVDAWEAVTHEEPPDLAQTAR